jgi:hypothetical protein
MPEVVVDEAELSAKNRVISFVNQALTNPKTRTRVLEIQKELDPNFTAPELQQREYVDERMDRLEKLIVETTDAHTKREQERDAAAQKRDLEHRWLTGRKSVRDAGYTEEGVGQLEEFMEHNGIVDHGIALPAFEKLHPPPAPVSTGDNRWGFFDAQTTESPDLKPLFEGREEDFLRSQIAATLADVRGQR